MSQEVRKAQTSINAAPAIPAGNVADTTTSGVTAKVIANFTSEPAGPIEEKTPARIADADLFAAIDKGDAAAVKAAVTAGADVNAVNKEGETPLTAAKEKGNPSVLEALGNARAKVASRIQARKFQGPFFSKEKPRPNIGSHRKPIEPN